MAKELPYFRFTAQEWQNGNISLESYALKGLFIDVCAYYWVQDCSITKQMLLKKFRNARKNIHELIELGILKHESASGSISILYLNKQFDLLSQKRMKLVNAGKKGGDKKASNAKEMPEQNSSYKDKDKENYKDKENNKSVVPYKINISDFLELGISKEKHPVFIQWLLYRKEIKKPIKIESTIKLLIKKFNSEPLDKCQWVVNHSVENTYQGLIWDKYKANGNNTPETRQQRIDRESKDRSDRIAKKLQSEFD